MKKYKQTMEKTRVIDKVFISKEALQSMVDHLKDYYISVWNGHDPRIPPIGRVADAELVKTGENTYEAVGEIEIFDDQSDFETFGEKEIELKIFNEQYLQLSYDKNFLAKDDQTIIYEISELFKSEAKKEEKHSIEHVSIISICASFLLGAVASGFLNKLGEDSYAALKHNLKKLFKKRKNESVLQYIFCVEKNGYSINVELFSTNPTQEDIEYMLGNGLIDFEKKLLPSYFNNDYSIRRLVFEQNDQKINLKFAVRKDGIPMKVEIINKQK